MVKTSLHILSVLVLVVLTFALIVVADVDFGDPELFLFTEVYGPNQKFDGYINFSLDNVDADSELVIELKNDGTIREDFPLLDVLDDQDLPYTCDPEDCSVFYTATSSAPSKKVDFNCRTFPCEKVDVGLLIDSDRTLREIFRRSGSITINFTIRGEPSDVGNFPIPSLDVGDDGSVEWRYLEPSGIFTQIPNPIDFSKRREEWSLTVDWEFCQNVTLPSAKRFRFGTRNLVDAGDITFNLWKTARLPPYPENLVASCEASPNSKCKINLTVEEPRDFLLCASSDAGVIPYYDGGFDKAFRFNVAEFYILKQQYDFPIFAEAANFLPFNFALSPTEEELSDIEGSIASYIDLDSKRCAVPFKFSSLTKGSIFLENLQLDYRTEPPRTIDKFFSIRKDTAKLNSTFSLIDLSELDLRVPEPDDYPDDYDESWKIRARIAGEASDLVDFEIAKVPVVRVKPRVGVIGFQIRFDASDSYSPESLLIDLVRFKWDFGDNITSVTTGPNAVHTYLESGIYTLTLEITDENDLTGIGIFKIDIGSSIEAIGALINLRISDFESFRASLPADFFERELILNATIGDEQPYRGNLTELNETYIYVLGLEGEVQEQKLALLQSILADFPETPRKVFDQFTFNTEIIADVDIADPEYIKALTGEQVTISFGMANAIALWQQENVGLSMNAKVKSVEYSDRTEELFSIVTLSISPPSGEYYLILLLPGEVIGFKQNVNSQEISSGVIGLTLKNEQVITFAMDSSSVSDIRVFASPRLSELGEFEGGPDCGNDFCEVGESAKSCPEDCARKVSGLGILLIILFIVIGVVVVFFVWYKHAKAPKTKLFKSKRDLENILSFIKKNIALGKTLPEIKIKLLKAGWTPEQIAHAIKSAFKEQETSKRKLPFFGR